MYSKLPIDEDDVALIFEDIHRGRSVIPPHPVPTRPMLVRWDSTLPLGMENCVVMEWAEGERHLKECFGVVGKGKDGDERPVEAGEKRRPEEVWGAEVSVVVARRRDEVRRQRKWVM